MLVLSRRLGEEVVIASDIRVTVLAVHGNTVKLGFSAPDDVAIMRSELVPGPERDTEPPFPVRRSVG
jgi:carbon storage regulator